MAVKIRLRQQGRHNRQTYRLVACDERVKRDGKYLEMLGWYDPFMKENNVQINGERTLHWIELGAKVSDEAKSLIARAAPEIFKVWNTKKEAKKVKEAARRKGGKSA